MRIMPGAMTSAAAPWIGALIAARSANCRSATDGDHRDVTLRP